MTAPTQTLKRSRERHPNLTMYIPYLLIVFAGVLFCLWTYQHEEHRLRRNLQQQVTRTANTIPHKWVEGFSGTPDDLTRSEHLRLQHQLRLLLHQMEDGSYFYLMGKNEAGDIVFLLDVSREEFPEDPSIPGDVYDEASPELQAAFRTGASFVEGPLKDSWGVWVSGFAPIVSEKGEILAFLGLDIDAADWNAAIRKQVRYPLLISVLFFLAAIGAHFQINRRNELKRQVADRTRILEWSEGRLAHINRCFLDFGPD
ncbi:MAG: hypothetical protein PF795_06770, partial [Kiritimatiellae bacterium]|nr:hypothetical protein [Kiritimatiellia bacterium]